MAAATINGTPSLFITPEPPTEKFPTYRDRVSNFTAIAENMANEGEVDTDPADIRSGSTTPKPKQDYQDVV